MRGERRPLVIGRHTVRVVRGAGTAIGRVVLVVRFVRVVVGVIRILFRIVALFGGGGIVLLGSRSGRFGIILLDRRIMLQRRGVGRARGICDAVVCRVHQVRGTVVGYRRRMRIHRLIPERNHARAT